MCFTGVIGGGRGGQRIAARPRKSAGSKLVAYEKFPHLVFIELKPKSIYLKTKIEQKLNPNQDLN